MRYLSSFIPLVWLSLAGAQVHAQLAPSLPFPDAATIENASEGSESEDSMDTSGDYEQPFVSTLARAGIRATQSSLRDWLRQLEPDTSTDPKQRELIMQLGHADYYQREAAVQALLKLAHINPELFAESLASPDLEIRWRAENIVKAFARKPDQSQLDERLHAAYQLIERRKYEGLVREILIGARYSRSTRSHRLAARALQATVTEADSAILRERLASTSAHERQLAVQGLAELNGEDLRDQLLPLLNDADDRVCVATAWSLARIGERSSLSKLVALLKSPELDVRIRAAQGLRGVTSQYFGFHAPAHPLERAAAVDKWEHWLTEQGDTVPLHVLLPELELSLDRTLICQRSTGQLIELDAQGKQVFEAKIVTPVSCQGLPNGHRLVASYNGREVVEYNASGKVVWRKNRLPGRPFSVRRLENGNTLVACTNSRRVVEIRPDGFYVKSYSVPGDAMDARRLENGWTVVALQNVNQIVELNPSRSIHWQLGGFKTPRAVQPLRNGNCLVAEKDAGKVVEVTREGKAVWSVDGLWGPCDAQRLPNGNTLIVESRGVREVDRAGKTVWEFKGHDCVAAHRF